MKLVKAKAPDELKYILKDLKANFIHPNWFDIKDNNKNNIGKITGYRLNIPLIMNDIIIGDRRSFYELDAISSLCMNLWHVLKDNINLFKDKTGELLFLNRLELKEKNTEIEKSVIEMLKDKYGFIIYSFGQTELFDDFERVWEEHECKEVENYLITSGWTQIDEFFIFENKKLTEKKEYPTTPKFQQDDFATPFEDWVKNKGINWINSLWQGIIKQGYLNNHFKRISELQKEHEDEYSNHNYLDAIKFVKELKITDFKQYDPRTDYLCEPPSYAKDLRAEALYVTYKKSKYLINFSEGIIDEDLMDEELMENILFGTYDKNDGTYCIGCTELFDHFVEGWLEDIFRELFNKSYLQYLEESNINPPKINNNNYNNVIQFADLQSRKKKN